MKWLLVLLLTATGVWVGAQESILAERRQRAATTFHDGVLLLHASSEMDASSDGFRQDPYFFYFTGLENTVGAILAIDGKKGEAWLFLLAILHS